MSNKNTAPVAAPATSYERALAVALRRYRGNTASQRAWQNLLDAEFAVYRHALEPRLAEVRRGIDRAGTWQLGLTYYASPNSTRWRGAFTLNDLISKRMRTEGELLEFLQKEIELLEELLTRLLPRVEAWEEAREALAMDETPADEEVTDLLKNAHAFIKKAKALLGD